MAELSVGTRLLLSLLLISASFLVWKWLQPAQVTAPAAKRKRKPKKKSNKKKETPKQEQKQEQSEPPSKPPADSVDQDSESDSDDGLSAAQVLATRKFQPKSLGGARLAKKIKASLPKEDAVRFQAGQQVLGRFEGGEQWFPATILELRKGNEYHLQYDDGEVEYRVPAARIKVRPASGSEDDEAKGQIPEPAAVREASSESESSESEDDGWQVVGSSAAAKKQARREKELAQTEPLVGGLTKRQRENRRKKERQKEMKEMLRQQAQKDDIDARARWRYAPS